MMGKFKVARVLPFTTIQESYSGDKTNPDNKDYGANMGPIWDRQDPDVPHVGPTDFAIWEEFIRIILG